MLNERLLPLWMKFFGLVWIGYVTFMVADYFNIRPFDLFIGLSLVKG